MWGSIIGGCNGGNGGGLLGVGTLGMAIGGAGGLVVGAIGGAIAATVVGWDATSSIISELIEGAANGTFKLW